MIFIFRSHPLKDTKPTTCENKGQIMPHKVYEGLPVTGTLQGVTGTTTPLPSKIKSWMIKRLQMLRSNGLKRRLVQYVVFGKNKLKCEC